MLCLPTFWCANFQPIIESDDESSEEETSKRPKKFAKDRSIQLTPIEKQLIEELDSMPKPKKRRKHKRKSSSNEKPVDTEVE